MKINPLWLILLLAVITSTSYAQEQPTRDEQIKKAVEQLKSDNSSERLNGIEQLQCHIASREYAKDVAKLLKDKDSRVRKEAVQTLGFFYTEAKEYTKDVAELLKDEDASVRYSAVSALGRLGAKEYAKDIAKFLKDKGDRSTPLIGRCIAMSALQDLCAKEYTKDIAELLKDEDCYVRQSAIYTLVNLSAKEYAKDIAELLKDDDVFTPIIAAKALVKLGAKEYAEDIAKISKRVAMDLNPNGSYNPFTRKRAIQDLEELDAKEQADNVKALLNYPDESVRKTAEKVLKKWNQLPTNSEQKSDK